MPLTKEELLKPRWKCIADYPDNTNEIGCILDRDWCRYRNDDEDSGEVIWRISDFPHLFQPLPWWSDRKPEDMPEYIVFKKKHMNFEAGAVYKHSNWHENKEPFCIGFITGEGEYDKCAVPAASNSIEPATEEEYTAYINQKQQ